MLRESYHKSPRCFDNISTRNEVEYVYMVWLHRIYGVQSYPSG